MREFNPISRFLRGEAATKTSALYRLTFPNGKIYIGISTNPAKRMRLHKRYASRGSKFAVHKAMRRFGLDAVRQDILLIGPTAYILAAEAAAIAAFKARNPRHGYNMAAGGGANPMDDPAIRERMRVSLTGRKDSEETCAKKRASWTPERRAAMSAVHKGKKLSPQHLAICSKQIEATRTPESRKKAADALRGRLRPQSVRDKISASLKSRSRRDG